MLFVQPQQQCSSRFFLDPLARWRAILPPLLKWYVVETGELNCPQYFSFFSSFIIFSFIYYRWYLCHQSNILMTGVFLSYPPKGSWSPTSFRRPKLAKLDRPSSPKQSKWDMEYSLNKPFWPPRNGPNKPSLPGPTSNYLELRVFSSSRNVVILLSLTSWHILLFLVVGILLSFVLDIFTACRLPHHPHRLELFPRLWFSVNFLRILYP